MTTRRPGRFRTWLWISSAVVVGGCLPVESGGPLDAVPMWTAELQVRIGSVDDPDYSLTWFRRMEVGPDGRMYTLHPMEQVVRIFDPDGSLEGLIGGRGGGPGEFENVFDIGWVADTLWVLDGRSYRFNQFSASGEFIGSFSVPIELGERDGPRPARPDGLLADGTVYGSPPAFSSDVADGTLTHDRPMLMTREGIVTDTLPSIAFGRNQWAISDPDDPRRGGMYTRQPFADGPLWAYVPNERALVVLDRESPAGAEHAAFRVTKLTFSGDTVYSRTHPFVPIRVAPQEVDSLLNDMGSMLEERGFLGVTEGRGRQWAELTFYRPTFRPGVAQMVLARDGSIWLSTGPDGLGHDDWLVLDSDGRPIGRVKLPVGLDVLVIDPPHLWASETDELDVPYLVRFRIE